GNKKAGASPPRPSCLQDSALVAGALAHIVGGLADLALDLAGVLLDVAFELLAAVAGGLADAFLDGAAELTFRAFRSVLVHDVSPVASRQWGRRVPNQLYAATRTRP